MSSINNTYYIDVNSNYRDINKYPNPCDFGITFQNNQSTGNFSDGLPFDNNYFYNKGSLDPDFLNTNINLENCIIDNYKESSSSISYICGSTIANTNINFYWKGNSVETLPSVVSGSNSPFLIKLDTTNQSNPFEWFIYLSSTGYTGYVNNSSRSTFQFDSNGNLVYEFDFSGESVTLYRYDKNAQISGLLTIANPKGKKICQAIVKIDSDGNLGLYNGRNWGYHILSSNFDLSGTLDEGQFSLTVDTSDNIITTVNTTPYTNTPDVTIIPNNYPTVTSVYSLPYFTPYGCYQKRYNGRDIFMYCTSVAQSQQGSITGAINFVDNNSTGSFILGSSPLTYPTNRSLSEIYDFQFIECNNKLYGVQITYLISNSAGSQTGYFYGINYTGGYNVNLLAGLPVRIDYKISAVSIGTNIYITGWRNTDSRLYIFKYDTVTNTMSNQTSYLLPISNPSVVRHVWPKAWTDGTDMYIIAQEMNSNNSTVLGNVNVYGMKYVVGTNTLSIQSTVIYPKRGSADTYIFDNGVSKYHVSSSMADTDLYILDISDITNLRIITATVNTSGYLSFYSVNAGTTVKYFLGLCSRTSNVTYFYDVSNINNISYINTLQTYTDTVYQNTNSLIYINSNNILLFSGILTGNRTNFASVFSKYPSNFTTTVLDSRHYNYNISTYLDIPSASTGPQMFTTIMNTNNYIVTADQSTIFFYRITDILGSGMEYTYSYSFSSLPSDITSEEYDGINYIAISNSNKCNLFSVDTNIFSSFSYIKTITIPTGYIEQSFLKTINGSLRLIIVNNNNTLYSCVYPEFDILQTYNYTVYPKYNGGYINYYAENDDYILTTFTAASSNVPAYSSLLPYTYTGTINAINIDSPTGISLSSQTTSLFLPQSKVAVTPFYFNNNSYTNIGFDYSTTNSIQRTSGQVWNMNNYNSYTFVGGISSYYSNYYYLKPTSSIVTANECYLVFCQNSATGYTGPFPPATGGLIYPTDTIYFERFDGTSVYGNISNVQTNGNVLQMKTITYNNKNMLICLLNSKKIYLYDVTDPSFSATNQNLTIIDSNNIAGINFGNSFISKILNDGTPSFNSFIGSFIDSSVISQYVNLSNAVIDSTNQYLYAVGNWTDSAQFYSNTSTGSYVLTTNLVKYGFKGNCVLFQMRISDGVFGWCLPCLGDKEDFFTKLQYNLSDNSIYVSGYSYSSNFNIYNTLSGLSSTFPTTIQYILTTYSFGSGFILKFSTSGTYRYNITLYSLQSSTYVKVLDLSLSSSGIVCCGISNSNLMKCLDSTLTNSQDLYSDNDIINDINAIFYKFDLSGNYISSNNVKLPTTNVFFRDIKQYVSSNSILTSLSMLVNRTNSKLTIYNKDGTLASDNSISLNKYNGYVVQYKYDSSYSNSSGQKFSQLVLKSSAFDFTENMYQNYKVFIQGNVSDTTLNNNFSIRGNYVENYYNLNPYTPGYTTGAYVFLLNDYIDIKNIIRSYPDINSITGSSDYLNFNLSKTNLGCVITYGAIYTGAYNFINTTKVYGSLSTTEQQYILLPTSTGTNVVRIKSVEYIRENVYSIFLDDINSLKVNGVFYGPELYIGRINPSVFYNLQFFPGSITYPTYFYVSILSITIPNRPLTNLSSLYGGQRTINDLPYIYVSIYNANDNDNFDPAIVNIVYDNTSLSTRPYPQYLIPVSNQGTTNNFATFTSNYSPVVKFSPGYYNLRVKIMDNEGNIIVFDPSSTKTSDTTFTNGKVPNYLMNVYLRLSAKKV